MTLSKKLFAYLALPLALLFGNGSERSIATSKRNDADNSSGTLERLIVAHGIATIGIDLNQLGSGGANKSDRREIRYVITPNSFFTALVFNNVFRGPEIGSMSLAAENPSEIPHLPKVGFDQLVLEKSNWSEPYDLVVRDGKTASVVFNIDRNQYEYDAARHVLNITNGRLLISPELAKELGHLSASGVVAGNISVRATMYPIQVSEIVNQNIEAAVLPPANGNGLNRAPLVGTVPGPDVIVGDLSSMEEDGASGDQVGLAIGTTSCNNGAEAINWFALPSNDHPVIPQNLYRMSANWDRFEQIGQSWLKHAFLASEGDLSSLGCSTSGCVTGTHLCTGCADPYSAGTNASQNGLGSRAWVNPFTGLFPGSNPNPNNHSGHVHTGTSHRVLVNVNDLNTSLNPGAIYFAEGQYISPHEYAWCQSHPGQCNMYNNVSYRQFNVSGTTDFTFSAAASTVRMQPAIYAWPGATFRTIEPAPGADGIAIIGYKVTNPSAGIWHYDYAIYNENLDRSIQSFSVPSGCDSTTSNLGFHAPPQHPGFVGDGTFGGQGYSSTPWAPNQMSGTITWACETFTQNQNANAIRYGTLYNFRFDSNKPPTNANAIIGFFKTGSPITVAIQAPMADPCNPLQLTSVVSRKSHGGAGTFDVDLPVSGSAGVECRSSGGNHTLLFTFTNNVVSGTAAVTSGTGNVSGSPVFSGNTMTVNLAGVSDQQEITVTVSSVMDTFGQTLPDTASNAVMLIADTSGNRSVNASDIAQTKAQIGAPVDASNFRTDINATGTINATDVSQVKASNGHSVP